MPGRRFEWFETDQNCPAGAVSNKMRFSNPSYPTNDELRAWAAGADPVPPMQDWDLVLSWSMDPGFLRLCVELAEDTAAGASSFFSWCCINS